ncbi:MAG: glycosyltransferase family 9 protein [Alphaproteobacteria bacterium]|nr:glycosyltransferase family 9 protein [Alphaproteobacteria bacterium]
MSETGPGGGTRAAANPRAEQSATERILVIRLGALGDFVLSLGPFAAIRKHHETAHITLLTSAPYADLARACGAFDDVWVDERPTMWQIGRWLALRSKLRGGHFARVYDLQTSDRSGAYFRLLGLGGPWGPGRRPEWSGIAPGASHPDTNPERNQIHTIERQREQLRLAGIAHVPLADLSWAQADLERFDLEPPYALIVPGGAPHRPEKRWPLSYFVDIASRLAARGLQPVVIGGKPEVALGVEITAACAPACDLTGQTDFQDIAVLARGAKVALGNDTGPMHLIALACCPSVVLFSGASDPARTAPRAPERAVPVAVLREDDLAALDVNTVWAAVAEAAAIV